MPLDLICVISSLVSLWQSLDRDLSQVEIWGPEEVAAGYRYILAGVASCCAAKNLADFEGEVALWLTAGPGYLKAAVKCESQLLDSDLAGSQRSPFGTSVIREVDGLALALGISDEKHRPLRISGPCTCTRSDGTCGSLLLHPVLRTQPTLMVV